MILKNSLILITVLWVSLLAAAYSDYDDEESYGGTQNTQVNTADIALSNEEIYGPALLQQEVEISERRAETLNNIEMEMDYKTETPLKNVRNVSENQLSNESTSVEHDDEGGITEAEVEVDSNNHKQSTEQNSIALSKEQEYETENPLNKNVRMGRLFTSTTTVPQYINKLHKDKPITSAKDLHFSNSDYNEDEKVDHMLKKHTTTVASNRNLEHSSEENDEIVPLAMKYYDEIPPENASSARHIEEVSSEDYYEEEYHDHGLITKTTSTTTVQTPDDNVLRSLFGGFTTTTTTAAIVTRASTTTSPASLGTTLAGNNPIIGQFDSSILTTLAPLPAPPQSQTQLMTGITTSNIATAVASALSNDKRAKQIPIISTVPVGTTTTASTSRRRLLPHEQLRNYIEDAYIRMPLAVIVDPSAESLEKTKSLWNDAMHTNLNIKIVLVTLNESEETPAAFNFNNTRQFLTGLNSIKEQHSGDAFRGISHAAELVPYDSAVFISTAQLAQHSDQVQDSAITLLKKRIRLYLIWFGERSLSENETQDSVGGILGEVAIRSGGEILHIVGSENSQELEGSTHTIVADALRGSQEVEVPVDTTLSSLHIKIDKLMRRAVLETPNGEINLKKLVKFKTHPLTSFDDDKRLDAYVPLTKLRKATIFKLKLIPENLTTEYSVFIRGERKADAFLDDMIKHFETYFFDGNTSYPSRLRSRKSQSLKSIENMDFAKTHANIKFPLEISQPKSEVETFSKKEIHHNTVNNSSSLAATTVQPQGRTTNFLQRFNTKIEMDTRSQVIIAPDMVGQLYFEVTNTGQELVYYTVQVVDERRYLMRLTPQSFYLRSGQTTTVTVTVLIPQNTPGNTVDHITFSVAGSGTTTSLSLNLKVITTIDSEDYTSPSIEWTFGSRCEGISTDSSTCSERFWNLYITVQDWQTGIMRLQSTPHDGLIYTKPYTIGTNEPLKATYIASCCEPKVSLVAHDIAGNQRSTTIDVRDIVLTEASIAAIALGVILLILLIVLLVAAIVWCCRRRKVVLDLPTYRSHSTRSME